MYLSLNGKVYDNNTIISISDIGETDTESQSKNEGLQCITDKNPCCKIPKFGEWLFPGGSVIPKKSEAKTFYRNRGNNDGTVNLNHFNSSIMSPTGLFCCIVPDFNDDMQSLCVDIGKTQLCSIDYHKITCNLIINSDHQFKLHHKW